MKRKLDANGEPALGQKSASEQQPAATSAADQTTTSFSDFGLDPRLVQAVAQEKYREPTLVQSKAIPLALEGKDVLAKAKTGSGKTAAYLLPVLQAILKRKQSTPGAFIAGLILVPTRELADQVHKVIESLTAFCAKDIQAIKLTDKVSDAVQRSLLSNSPDIVVSTPSRAWSNISSSALSLEKLTHLVLDEADLVLSYGYEEDLQNVAKTLPKAVQTILMSATLTTEVDTLKGIFARNPVVLNLVEKDGAGEGVSQYVVKCSEEEKFLLIYVILKLKLIKGKSIIFVADVDRCYRLKLYFEQFGIRSCILNSELPVNSRIHVVEEFNKNVYDIIIASDESEVIPEEDTPKEDTPKEDAPKEGAEGATKGQKEDPASKAAEGPKKKRQRTTRRDKEYGVSRGIDFKNVACVINFDLPTSAKSYTHRIGRTGRAGQTGMALSFVIPTDQYRKHPPTWVESTEHDEKILARITRQQEKQGKEVKPYNFDMGQVDAFRYRMNDALRAVTKVAVREARTRELREELLRSEKLKRHFEENPTEMHHLRHDGELRAARTQAHLKHVPGYLMPADGKGATQDVGFVPFNKTGDKKVRRQRKFKVGKRKAEPLRSFKARTRK